jgi:hypothetical protein
MRQFLSDFPREPTVSAGFSRTRSFVASSAAALVSERVIVLPSPIRQHSNFTNLQKNGKALIVKGKLEYCFSGRP